MCRFADTFLNWAVMAQYAPKIVEGTWVTIRLALAVVIAGIACGLFLSVLRAFRFRAINVLIVFAVDVLRALPPLVIISASQVETQADIRCRRSACGCRPGSRPGSRCRSC